MGKPSPRLGVSDDALSLHSQPGEHSHAAALDGILDTDAPELNIDGLPPLHDEIDASGSSNSAPLLPSGAPPYINDPHSEPYNERPHGFYRDLITGTEIHLHASLEIRPKILQRQCTLDQQDLVNSQEAPQESFGHLVVDGAASSAGRDLIIRMLAEKSNEDPQLRDLMKRVAQGEASKTELEQFQGIINAITSESKRKANIPVPPTTDNCTSMCCDCECR